jgi:hypothetical protein
MGKYCVGNQTSVSYTAIYVIAGLALTVSTGRNLQKSDGAVEINL